MHDAMLRQAVEHRRFRRFALESMQLLATHSILQTSKRLRLFAAAFQDRHQHIIIEAKHLLHDVAVFDVVKTSRSQLFAHR